MRVAAVGGRAATSLAVALVLTLSSEAAAMDGVSGLEESSRITLLGGWQHENNVDVRQGLHLPASGGPLGSLTFGYSPFAWGELGIDLFAGAQRLWRGATAPWGASYGAMIGGRLQLLLPIGSQLALIPRIGAHVGPVIVTGPDLGKGFTETFGTAIAGSAGLEARLSPEWSLNLEYRYLLAQGVVEVADAAHVFNSGGHSLLLGATFSFLPGSRGTWSL